MSEIQLVLPSQSTEDVRRTLAVEEKQHPVIDIE